MIKTKIVCVDFAGTQTVLFDSDRQDTHWFTKAVFSPAENAAGKFVFTLLPQHPSAQRVQLMGSDIQISMGSRIIFSGRPITVEEDIYRCKTVTCEGNLNWALDVPDLFTRPWSMQHDYYVAVKNGEIYSYVSLEFTAETTVEDGETKYTGLYDHTWHPGEYMNTFDGENEGQKFEFLYRLPRLKKNTVTDTWAIELDGENVVYDDEISVTAVCERALIGSGLDGWWWDYIGNPELAGVTRSDTVNGSVPLATAPFGGVEGLSTHMVLRCPEHANAGIPSMTVMMMVRGAAKQSISDMFYLMFPKYEDLPAHNYNNFCSPQRRLYGGDCDIVGELVYEHAVGTTCLDTLREWQKTYGGYLYTRREDLGYWSINYTNEPGEEDSGAVFELGDNILDITYKVNAENVVTKILGIGKDDQTGEEVSLLMSDEEFRAFVTATTEAKDVTLIPYNDNDFPLVIATGIVSSNDYSIYGQIIAAREYGIKHLADNKAAMRRILYGKVVEDLKATSAESEMLSITAIDPRILDKTTNDIRVGNSYLVKSKPHRINQFMRLTSMEMDLLSQQNTKLTFGETRPLASNDILKRK